MKFKVGDKVKVIRSMGFNDEAPKDYIGQITGLGSPEYYEINKFSVNSHESELELIEETPKPTDKVTNPTHYNTGNIEVIDFIEDQGLGFKDGNVVKYVCRFRHKNGLEDLKKAKWYLERLISEMEK